MASQTQPIRNDSLYETDFYGWTQQQAQMLEQGCWDQLDIPNLVEEIESLGRQERRELTNRFGILLGHLLKWQHQPELQGKSWVATIREQRREIIKLLQRNPSLQPYQDEAVTDGYEQGLDLVVRETSLDYADLPSSCPYSLSEILDPAF
jgi:hypothetical protein